MYRLNIKKKNVGDLVVLLLFDKMFNEEFVKESEIFNELVEIAKSKGLKSKLFGLYFDIDPLLRSKYKQFSNKIEDDNVTVHIINEGIDEDFIYEKLITETVKQVTGKENPNEQKLKKLITNLLESGEY